MKHNLKCYYGRRDLHFVTFSCFHREPLLGSAYARNVFLKILSEVGAKYRFSLGGYVLAPEHVHMLIGEPAIGTPSKVIQVLKQRVSRRIRRKKRRRVRGQLKLSFYREKSLPRRFWQRRFYDFNVWTRGKLEEKLNYMRANPVVRGLVKHPRNWPWSSWSFYERKEEGLIRKDSVEK